MSEKGSKDNLAEEKTTLLEEEEKAGDTPEKEEVEAEEKKDEKNEKEDKKKKKEKKVKVPKVPKPKGPSCVETLSSGLDMAARDKDGINVEIDVRPSSFVVTFDRHFTLPSHIFSSTSLTCWQSPAPHMGSIPCGDCLSSCSARPSSGSTDLSPPSSSSLCPSSGRSSLPSSPSSMSGSSDPSSRLSRLSSPYLKG